MILKATFGCLVGLFLSLACAAESIGATITLQDETSVVAPVVRLSDLGTITGTEPQDQLEALGFVPISSSPAPSETMILSINAIAYSLSASGVDLSGLRFEGAAQAHVRREYALVSVDEFQKVFSEHVSERTGWPRDSFIANPPKNMQPVPVPVGTRKIIAETFPEEDFQGSVFVRFQIWIDETLYRELAHRFLIERYVKALVASHKISRGQYVDASDVEVKKVEQSRLDDESFVTEEEIAGLQAVRTIYPDTVLTPDLLTMPPLVRRGQHASVVVSGDGFNIMTRGRVLENGTADQLVRVRLLSSRKIVKARVVDSKTLKMNSPRNK